MVPAEKTQAASLILTLLAFILMLCPIDIRQWGISQGCTFWQRLAYPFLHASWLHVGLNCWCLLSIVFTKDIKPWQLIMAYIIAVTYPVDLLSSALASEASPSSPFSPLASEATPSPSSPLLPSAAQALSPSSPLSTVGISGFIFALLGTISLQSRKWYLNIAVIGSFIAIGFFVPGINATLHLYCYLAGLLVSVLTTPYI